MTGHKLMAQLYEHPEYEEIPVLLIHYEWPGGMWSHPTRNGRTAIAHLLKPIPIRDLIRFISRIFRAQDEQAIETSPETSA